VSAGEEVAVGVTVAPGVEICGFPGVAVAKAVALGVLADVGRGVPATSAVAAGAGELVGVAVRRADNVAATPACTVAGTSWSDEQAARTSSSATLTERFLTFICLKARASACQARPSNVVGRCDACD